MSKSNNNNGTEFSIDESQLAQLFEQLKPQNQEKAFRDGLKKSLKIVQRQAKANLKGVVKKGEIYKKNRWNGKTLASGIKVSADKNTDYLGAQNWFAKVHILGDFRLRFFEKGTNPRETKKGYNRGQMHGTNFFSNAKLMAGKRAEESLTRCVAESIQKIFNKNKK